MTDMYSIIRNTDGSYSAAYRLQGDRETHRFSSGCLDEAVKWVKQGAKVGNGTKLKRKNIAYYEVKEEVLPTTKLIPKTIPDKH